MMDDKTLERWIKDYDAYMAANPEPKTELQQRNDAITEMLARRAKEGNLIFFDNEDEYILPEEPVNPINSGVTMKQKSDGGSSSYYELPYETNELQDLIEHRKMNFAIGNIFKACYRLGSKAGIDDLYDIKKIIWYAEREKARIERELENGQS